MKRRIRYMALLLAVCMLALTGCAQPRDTMTLRVCLDDRFKQFGAPLRRQVNLDAQRL